MIPVYPQDLPAPSQQTAGTEATTDSLDLPPAFARLLESQPVQQSPALGLGGAGAGSPSTYLPNAPTYQEGGMVGPGGMPIRPDQGGMPMEGGAPMQGGQPGLAMPGSAQPVDPQQMMAEAQRFAAQRPQQMQQIQMAIQQAMQSGELTQQELTMITQMAMVALQNPELYPQLRQLAIQQGLATEQDLSPQYDQGLLFALLLVGQSMQQPMQGAPNMGGQQPMPSMAAGGPLPAKSSNADGSIPIRAHEGEYVVPAEVVRAKGTEFFDKLVQSYRKGE